MAINGVPRITSSATPKFPEWIDIVYLDDANAQAYTVPSNVGFVIITPNGDVWARISGTAAVPAADVTDGSGSLRIAAGASYQCQLGNGDTLSLIREDASNTTVVISCWRTSAFA